MKYKSISEMRYGCIHTIQEINSMFSKHLNFNIFLYSKLQTAKLV